LDYTIYHLTFSVAMSNSRMSPKNVVKRAMAIRKELNAELERQAKIQKEEQERAGRLALAIRSSVLGNKRLMKAKSACDALRASYNAVVGPGDERGAQRAHLMSECNRATEKYEKMKEDLTAYYRKKLEETGILSAMAASDRLRMPEPMNYVRFMSLVFNCRFVITDSGGIQEETSYLGIPCLTVRENTERPVTVTHGTNQLCELAQLKRKAAEIIQGQVRSPKKIELWDGKTAGRIVEIIAKL